MTVPQLVTDRDVASPRASTQSRRYARQRKPCPAAAVTCISGWSGCCRAAVYSAPASLVPELGVWPRACLCADGHARSSRGAAITGPSRPRRCSIAASLRLAEVQPAPRGLIHDVGVAPGW